jgi:hypothetical protein
MLWLATAHPLTTTHMVVSPLLPHAQFTPECPLAFGSCSGMSLLLWLLWFIATFEEEGELAAPIASPFFFAEAFCQRLVHVRLRPPKLDLTDYSFHSAFTKSFQDGFSFHSP